MKKSNGAVNNNIPHKTEHQELQPSQSSEWDDTIPLPKLSFKLSVVTVFIAAVLCFINSHDGDFVFDDSEAIINNPDVLPETPIGDLFSHDFWGNRLVSNTSHKSFRPLTMLTFRLNYILAGGLHPWGFHVTNIILHALCSVLVLILCSTIFSVASTHACPKASLLSSLLFAVHPIHTESVAGIVGRADLMCAVCFLLSLLSYIHSLNTGVKDMNGRPVSISLPHLVLSIILCTSSVFFKEQGITVIGVCSVYDVIVHCKLDVLELASLCYSNNGVKVVISVTNNNESPKKVNTEHQTWVRPLLLRHLLLLITGISILSLRWWVMGSTTPTFQVVDNPHSFVNGTLLRAINYNYLYAINGWLLLNPWWLCFDWSMGCVPVIHSLTDIRILAVIGFWLVAGSVIYTALKSLHNPGGRLLSLSIAMVVIPFLPGANLFFRVGFVVAERILYLPSIGFCVLVTIGVAKLSRNTGCKNLVKLLISCLLLLFVIRCVRRSNEWRKEKTLFDSGATVCPGNAKVHYNIGKIASDEGSDELAMEKYRLALQLNPDYDQAMNNLANILKEGNQLLEAETLLEKALQIRSTFAAAWMNLGIVQTALNKTSLAELSYKTAISHRNKYPDCYYNLGNLYLNLKRHEEALNAWLNATRLKPSHDLSWNNMLILMDNLGNVKLAESLGAEAIKHLPENPDIRYNLANCYGRGNMFEKSEENFLKAIELRRDHAPYYSNLGVLYHRWGKYGEAKDAYEMSLKLSPNSQHTQKNYDMLKRAMDKIK